MIGRYKRGFSFLLLFRLKLSLTRSLALNLYACSICYIIIHFDFFSFALCMLLKWAECQVRLHKRHACLLMNYSLTIRSMYVYMSVIRSVAAYCHTVLIKKRSNSRRCRKRGDLVMSDDDDDVSSCHFNSIKLLNVRKVKWQSLGLNTVGGEEIESVWMRDVRIVHYHQRVRARERERRRRMLMEFNKDEYTRLPYLFLLTSLHHRWLFWTGSYQLFLCSSSITSMIRESTVILLIWDIRLE